MSWGHDIGRMVAHGVIAMVAAAFVAGVLVTAVLVWLWPHLPSIRLVW
jgi:hypothetical protein